MSIGTLERPSAGQCICLTRRQRKYLKIKRVVDFFAALAALAFLSPVFLAVAAALKIESPRDPVIFRQKRVGARETVFTVYKFRTMGREAPREVSTWALLDAQRYITPLGHFLRNTSVDELPQLLNVLRGEMSLLGPRPVILSEEEVHRERSRWGVYQVRPGLSGLAQVRGRDALSPEEKVLWDKRYVEQLGPGMDLKVFLLTVRAVILRSGIIDGREQKQRLAQGNAASAIKEERVGLI